MTRVFADTYFFLALLSRRDHAHDWAKSSVAMPHLRWMTTTWVLTEVADGMSIVGHRQAAARLIRSLLADDRAEGLPPSIELFHRALELYGRRLDKDWSLTDCSSFVAMHDAGIHEVLSGDRHFEQAGFRLFSP